MSYTDKIVKSPNETMYGTVLIKGTEISVSTILRDLSKGLSVEEILKDKSQLTIGDIYDCLEYAAELVAATNFKKAQTAINTNIEKRKALANRLRALADDIRSGKMKLPFDK